MPQINTFRPDNLFTFSCPIFGVDVEMRACMHLHHHFTRAFAGFNGDRTTVRQGCQACMASSKCPMWHIKRDAERRHEDPYFSATKVQGHLQPSLLADIAPIQTCEFHISRFNVSEREALAIRAANEVTHTKKRGAVELDAVPAPAPVKKKGRSKLVEAAVSGDLAAAINAGDA